MTFFGRRQAAAPRNTKASSPSAKRNGRVDEASFLDWEFGDGEARPDNAYAPAREADAKVERDQPAPAPAKPGNGSANVPIADAFRRTDAPLRVAALVERLDDALDRWWSDNELPAAALLREALLALKAGHKLDEGQLSLLLRTALKERKGVLTALRYQTEPERTAFILKEAVLDLWSPLPVELLWRLRTEDKQGNKWAEYLITELTDEIHAVHGVQQQLAMRALDMLEKDQPPPGYTGNEDQADFMARTWDTLRPMLPSKVELAPTSYWSPGRVMVAVILVVVLIVGYFLIRWGSVNTLAISIPAGSYSVSDPTNGERHTVNLAAFEISKQEVTNAEYVACVEAGKCAVPKSAASATRPDYLTHPAYANFPVVNVDWDEAAAYCAWINWRLPTASEWEVAASVASATGQHYRYPWGDAASVRQANTSEVGTGDTQTVGSYSPSGDSPWGAVDMAGNAAEWTATATSADGNEYFVKGGSFHSDLTSALTDSAEPHERQFTSNWLGFRCAADS